MRSTREKVRRQGVAGEGTGTDALRSEVGTAYGVGQAIPKLRFLGSVALPKPMSLAATKVPIGITIREPQRFVRG